MPLHGAGRAAALGDAGDIDGLDVGKDVDLEFLADLQALDGRAEFANEPLGFGAGLGDRLNAGGGTLLLTFALKTGDVAALAAAGQTTGLIQESELDRFVAIAVGRLHLEDMARTRLDHRNRNYASGGSKTCVIPTLRPSSPNAIVLALIHVALREDPAWGRFTRRASVA